MVRTYKKTFKQHKIKCINKGETLEEKRQIARNLTKRYRLSKNVKYVLNQLSHYSLGNTSPIRQRNMVVL